MVCYSDNKIRATIRAYVLVGLLFASVASPARAQDDDMQDHSPQIGIYHIPEVNGSTLPPPGYPIQFKVQLFNTKDVTIPLRTFADIDGRLIELTPSKAYLNKDDYPEYIIETHAPRTSITYNFVAYGPNGEIANSEEFELQRSCLPNITPVSVDLTSDPRDGGARLTEIVHTTWALEREFKAYEHAKAILEAIKGEIARLDGKK